MRLKGIFVACCLLVFLAVVHGEAGHDETEHVDDDQEYELDRERREAGDTETNVDGPAAEKEEGKVIDREKRCMFTRLPIICLLLKLLFADIPGLPHPPCRPGWYKVKVKRRCGWWRRRHTCY
ncbi:hypothetical protein LSAT2_023954, partial [Lamellibrachia satsuma]